MTWACRLWLVCVLISGAAVGQTIYTSPGDPGDGNPNLPGAHFAASYADLGPGGLYPDRYMAGFLPLNGSCGSEARVYPSMTIYRYYGEMAGPVCAFNGSAWSLISLPTVSACLPGYTLASGLCVVDSGGVTALLCEAGDSETVCLTRRVNALIEQVAPSSEPYDGIAGFGFFSLTMGGVLFTYFFSVGIGLILQGVKEW